MTDAAVGLGPIGVWSRELRYHTDRAAAVDAAAELEELGYGALWIPDAGGDVLGVAGELLAATRRVAIATGILNIWMHGAGEVTRDVAALGAAHPGRFLLGLGASHSAIVPDYGRPFSMMVAYLDALDALDPSVPPQRRALAALRPRMLELAAGRAAGAHPYFVPAEHTARAREVLGPDPLLAPEVAVVLEADPARARAVAREYASIYLGLPNYTGNLRTLGFSDDDVSGGGSDRLIDAVVPWGDEEVVADRVRQHLQAGADHVCIQVVAPHLDFPLAEYRQLAPALVGR
jgi:probable F420-dependent oxidoreductase